MIVCASPEILPEHQHKLEDASGQRVLVYRSLDEIPEDIASHTDILIMYGGNLSYPKGTKLSIARFTRLEWVHFLTIAINQPLTDELRTRSLLVTNSTGIQAASMSEYVLASMLYFEKDFHRYSALKREKRWDRSVSMGELTNREVLIFGTGSIGTAIARTLKPFRVRLTGVNTTGKPADPFDMTLTTAQGVERLSSADYVVSIIPDTPDTDHLFGRDNLLRMKKEAVFINVGRGNVLDEQALAELLNAGRLKGAALDVFREEPPAEDNPLWTSDNLILTPHMSAKSTHYIDSCLDIFIHNLKVQREGKPADELINVIRTDSL